MLRINFEQCIQGGTCSAVCPETVFVQHSPKTEPECVHTELCFAGGHCVALCPKQAIAHNTSPAASSILPEMLPIGEQVLALRTFRRQEIRISIGITSPKGVEDFGDVIPMLILITNAGGFPGWKNPNAVNACVHQFLSVFTKGTRE